MNQLDKVLQSMKERRKPRNAQIEGEKILTEVDKSYMTVFIGAIAKIEENAKIKIDKTIWNNLRKEILDVGNRERRKILAMLEKFLDNYIFTKENERKNYNG